MMAYSQAPSLTNGPSLLTYISSVVRQPAESTSNGVSHDCDHLLSVPRVLRVHGVVHAVVKVVTRSRAGSPDEARLEQTPYPFHNQLIWRYLGIK